MFSMLSLLSAHSSLMLTLASFSMASVICGQPQLENITWNIPEINNS
jgi:hypothetical protein